MQLRSVLPHYRLRATPMQSRYSACSPHSLAAPAVQVPARKVLFMSEVLPTLEMIQVTVPFNM